VTQNRTGNLFGALRLTDFNAGPVVRR
jgi:hypothetical protein